jgi:hypothetical protein
VTRLTAELMPEEMKERLTPEAVAPLVIYLCSEQCAVSGATYSAGMGHFGRVGILTGAGVDLGRPERPATAEEIAATWGKIVSLSGAQEHSDANAALGGLLSSSRA